MTDSSRQISELERYIDAHAAVEGRSTIPGSDQLRRWMTPGGRLRAKLIATRAQAPRSRRIAARMAAEHGAAGRPIRLHLGSGWHRIEGWINVDLVGAPTDFTWDLRVPLPFADGSVDAIFLEHVFEHITYAEALVVLRNAGRALKPGGVVRVGVPDAGMFAQMYAEDRERLRTLFPNRPTAMLMLREVFQEHGHVAAYDEETLVLILAAAGFPGARRTAPGTSELLDDVPDFEERWFETVYVEAVRPTP